MGGEGEAALLLKILFIVAKSFHGSLVTAAQLFQFIQIFSPLGASQSKDARDAAKEFQAKNW